MKIMCIRFLVSIAFILISFHAESQTAWYYQWGLVPDETMDLFIAESSGERVFNTVTDLSEYNRVRSTDEYTGTLFESQYIIDRLNEYRLEGANIERFGKVKVYRPVTGELYEVSPSRGRLADITDLPFLLSPGSPNTETEGELVYIGDGFTGELDKMDLTDKIVVTSARPGGIMNSLLQKGVKGIVSFYTSRVGDGGLIISDPKGGGFSRGGQTNIFVFNLPPREGAVLRDRLIHGEKIRVRANIRFRTEEIDIQVPTCVIEGTDSNAGEVIISAHLYEGYTVQGANDNLSGSATILEAARMINSLIADGRIQRPRRSVRFIWVPEFSGTIPWVKAHMDLMKKTLCNINLDMVGLSISKYKSSFILHRTTYGNAHYINDVLENYYRYVGETNQMNSVISGSRFFKRIIAPTGTDDPFYYQIMSSSGGSDHVVFNDWGVRVPGILMITWPDPFYHTSQDRVDKCDPTQMKRVAFITAISAYTVASASENEAINIAGEVYGNSLRRIGYQVAKAFDEINQAGADNLASILRKGMAEIKGTVTGEEMTLSSVAELAPSSQNLRDLLRDKIRSIRDLSQPLTQNLIRTAQIRASDFGMLPLSLEQPAAEKRASNQVPVLIVDPSEIGYEGLDQRIRGLSAEKRSTFRVTGVPDQAEAALCVNGKNSILDIKYLLDAQNRTETNLEGLTNYFNLMKEAGIIKFQ